MVPNLQLRFKSAAPLVPYLVEEPPHDELHIHIAFDRRGRVDHLEMAGEGQDGVGASVAFSARRPKLSASATLL